MRILLTTCLLLIGQSLFAQKVTALCDVLGDIEKHKMDSTMSALSTGERNFDGSYPTTIIPARFVESSFRDIGSGAFMMEFKTYGKPKQMEKVITQLIDEIAYCYPDYIIENNELDTEMYRQLFFCHKDDKGGSKKSADYQRLTFMISILHTEGDQSKIVLKF